MVQPQWLLLFCLSVTTPSRSSSRLDTCTDRDKSTLCFLGCPAAACTCEEAEEEGVKGQRKPR